jgi:hypothetical protein
MSYYQDLGDARAQYDCIQLCAAVFPPASKTVEYAACTSKCNLPSVPVVPPAPAPAPAPPGPSPGWVMPKVPEHYLVLGGLALAWLLFGDRRK